MKRLPNMLAGAGVLLLFTTTLLWMQGMGDRALARREGVSIVPAAVQGGNVQVEGDLAYVNGRLSAEYWGSIVIFDIADPVAPLQLSVIPVMTGEMWSSMDVVGNRLYAFEARIPYALAQEEQQLDWQGILHIFDVTNPSVPVELGRIGGFGFPGGVRASQDNKYVHLIHSGEDGVIIYDISQPNLPRKVSSYASEYGIAYYELISQFSYVVERDSDSSANLHMNVYDISNPTLPILASNQSLTDLTLDIYGFDISTEGLLVAAYYSHRGGSEPRCEIKLIDTSTLVQPVLLGEIEIECTVNDLHVNGNLLYTLGPLFSTNNSRTELRIYDISNPGIIKEKARYNMPTIDNALGAMMYFDLADTCAMGAGSRVGLHVMCTSLVVGVTPTPLSISTPSTTPTNTPASTATTTPTPTNTPTATVKRERVYLPLLAR